LLALLFDFGSRNKSYKAWKAKMSIFYLENRKKIDRPPESQINAATFIGLSRQT
jgi:hypothetical protein